MAKKFSFSFALLLTAFDELVMLFLELLRILYQFFTWIMTLVSSAGVLAFAVFATP
jgi:hypothetical protein